MKKVLLGLCLFLFCLVASAAVAVSADLETEIHDRLKTCRELAKVMQVRLGQGGSVASERDQLAALAENIRINDLLLRDRFTTRSEELQSFSDSAVIRQQAMDAAYRQAIDTILPMLDSLPPSEQLTASDLQPLIDQVKVLIPPCRFPILGNLPYEQINFPAVEPVVGPVVLPAYMGGTTSVTEADLAGSNQAQIILEIAALAESLDWNPVKIYE